MLLFRVLSIEGCRPTGKPQTCGITTCFYRIDKGLWQSGSSSTASNARPHFMTPCSTVIGSYDKRISPEAYSHRRVTRTEERLIGVVRRANIRLAVATWASTLLFCR